MESINLNQPVKSVINLLRITFSIVPIVAGLDKFTNLLTDWSQYLSPGIKDMLPMSPHSFMMAVGVVEIIAAVIVLIKPAVGGLIVAVWLTLIALTLIIGDHFFDVAVRDLVMAISAFSLARLSRHIL